jgi:hypothetical protein
MEEEEEKMGKMMGLSLVIPCCLVCRDAGMMG